MDFNYFQPLNFGTIKSKVDTTYRPLLFLYSFAKKQIINLPNRSNVDNLYLIKLIEIQDCLEKLINFYENKNNRKVFVRSNALPDKPLLRQFSPDLEE